MNLTEEQLKEVEVMAGLFFNPVDIVVMLGFHPIFDGETFKDIIAIGYTNPIFIAYWKGRLKAETELRAAVKQAAMNGSNPAQSTMIDYFNKSRQ